MGQLDYALIGNCQISALIDPSARIQWCCMPRFDAPAIFASLLHDETAGQWTCLPDAPEGSYTAHQRYLPNTNVLVTEFRLKNGDRYEVIDFAPRFARHDGYFRPPMIVRILRPLQGNPRVRVRIEPRFDYGRLAPEIGIRSDGLIFHADSQRLYLHSDIPATYLRDGQAFELSGPRHCVLLDGEPLELPLRFTCEEYLDRTVAYWRTWVKHASIPFEYQDAVIRSALALKLHIYEDTGAIIASATTSLPEMATGGRTWDYRYCWLRDAYFVIGVLNRLGHFEEMEKFIQYLHNIATSHPTSELQPVYGIGGERELHERELPWLDGFRGMGPVRVGNHAYTHDQYDVYGEMVLAVTPLFFDARLDRVDQSRAFGHVVQLVEQACLAFDKPDSGIWEFRSDQKHYVFSKVMCWAAVDRGLKIAERLGRIGQFEHWERARDRMRTEILTKGWNEERGIYTQEFGGTSPDAANLLMNAVNFHSGRDPQFRRMIENYEKVLVSNGHTFRYRNSDDFGVPQNSFTICSFWMVDALVAVGRKEEARRMFERVLESRNHAGLLSEDIDPATGGLWGNLPQTYSHVGIINSAFRLSKSWDDAF